MLDPARLRLLVAVARAGSITAAAEAIHLSQPALSRQVQALERAAGMRLLRRERKGVRPTPEGELVLRYAEEMVAVLDELERTVGELRRGVGGHLALAASTTPGHYLVPALLGAFREHHSGVTADLWIGDTATAARRVAERAADLGFIGSPPDLPDLAGQPFADDEIVLVASPRHPLASAGVVRPADLAREPFVVREPGSATMKAATAALARLDLSPPVAMVFGSDEALKAAVAAGLGIGALSRHAIAAELAAGLLTILPVAGWSCERQLWCIWRRGHTFRRVELAFLRLVGVAPPRLR